ncbi:MAG TPA: pitrilysin family protein, partial [Nitrospiria bacterium]|nr:pitrilysin family protein [Nitrospiria bacterium]
LPSNRMELWAAIESDRMKNPVLREFYKERDVVLEERRLRYDNTPWGKMYEAFIGAAFNAHPYRMPVIGWEADLKTLTRGKAEAFFEKYYGPDNAVIAIVGDIDPEETIRLVEKYFSKIKSRTPPTNIEIQEPPQAGEIRVAVEFDAEPEVMIGYHKPDMNHPDDAVFDVIDGLLSDGRSSILHRKLVTENPLAVDISTSTGTPGSRYPHLFMIRGTPRAPHTTGEVEAAVYAELERLKTEPVDPRDLEKVLNRLDARRIRALESNSGLSSQLSYFQGVAGDWRYVQNIRELVASVTAEDVMRVAREYFVEKNRVVATLVKKEGP